jgi:hypothetical protein
LTKKHCSHTVSSSSKMYFRSEIKILALQNEGEATGAVNASNYVQSGSCPFRLRPDDDLQRIRSAFLCLVTESKRRTLPAIGRDLANQGHC